MRRGTTQIIVINIGDDLNINDYTTIWVTISQNGCVILNKTGTDITIIDQSNISVELSQADTLSLSKGTIELQVRASKDSGATAVASNISTIAVDRILKDGEII